MSGDPRERSLEIEQAQLRGFARSISEVEWLLLVLVVLYLFIVQPVLAHSVSVLAALFAFAGFVLVFRYARPFGKRIRLKLLTEILAMTAFLTAVLTFAGGVATPLVNLFLLPIVTAALTIGKRATAFFVVLVCACYALIDVATVGTASLTTDFAITAVSLRSAL